MASCPNDSTDGGDGYMSASLEEEMRVALATALATEKEFVKKMKQFKDKYIRESKHQLDQLKELKKQSKVAKEPDRRIRVENFSKEMKQLQDDREKQLNEAVENQITDRIEKVETFLHRSRAVLEVFNDPLHEVLTPPVTLIMNNYEESKANNEKWVSPAFFSHRGGYKMCIQVYPNGQSDGLGSHVSVFVSILPGEYDDVLPWPFSGYVTIHLVNQKGKKHFSAIVNLDQAINLDMRKRPNPLEMLDPAQWGCWGIPQFAPHGRVEAAGMFSDQYLKEDTLTFCVWKVDTFNLHH